MLSCVEGRNPRRCPVQRLSEALRAAAHRGGEGGGAAGGSPRARSGVAGAAPLRQDGRSTGGRKRGR